MAVFTAVLIVSPAAVRDGNRPAPTYNTPPHAIPNPYAAPQPSARSSGDRAADAYSMGFAIGLGTALINRQREEEAKQQKAPPSR